MTDSQYQELLAAILDLRGATDLGFARVNERFDDVYYRLDSLDRRFDVLGSRVEHGFRNVSVSLAELGMRRTR